MSTRFERDDWKKYKAAMRIIAALFGTTVRCREKNGRLAVDFRLVDLNKDQANALTTIEDLVELVSECPAGALAKLDTAIAPSRTSWTTTLLDSGDGSGDAILQFPDELLDKLGWKEGDVLNIKVKDGVLFVSRKKGPKKSLARGLLAGRDRKRKTK